MAGQGIKFVSAFSKKDIESIFIRFQERAEEKMITILMNAGEYFIGEARSNGRYQDRTGNLRSSIGYVVVKDSQTVIQSDFEPVKVMARAAFTDVTGKHHPEIKESIGTEGSLNGQAFVNDLIRDYPTGIILIGVAGMDYAKYVECIHGLDVITGAAIKTQDYLRRSMLSLKAKM